jgi:hypothetical protein
MESDQQEQPSGADPPKELEVKSAQCICDEFVQDRTQTFKKFLINLRSASEVVGVGQDMGNMIEALKKMKINQKKLARKSLSKEISIPE